MEADPLKLVAKAARRIAPGREPSFVEVHVLKALETLGSEDAVGRVRLSRVLGLGEGMTRTLVRHLREEGLVEISRSGVFLSEFGRRVFSELRSRIGGEAVVPGSPLTVGSSNLAVLVRGVGGGVRLGVEERDAAIRVGALGATTLVFRGGRLTVPGVDPDALQNTTPVLDLLRSGLRPAENDAIVVGSADDRHTAELGAKAAALRLLRSKER